MAWCFSTRAFIATVLNTHPFVFMDYCMLCLIKLELDALDSPTSPSVSYNGCWWIQLYLVMNWDEFHVGSMLLILFSNCTQLFGGSFCVVNMNLICHNNENKRYTENFHELIEWCHAYNTVEIGCTELSVQLKYQDLNPMAVILQMTMIMMDVYSLTILYTYDFLALHFVLVML